MDKYLITRDVEEHYIIKASNEKSAIKIFNILTKTKDRSIKFLIKMYNIDLHTEITNYKAIMKDDDE